MPTIVGILTFISLINTTYERLTARNLLICRYFNFYEQLKFRAQLSILTFISLINATYEQLTARNLFICRYFNFYEQSEFRAQLR